jgi:tetratricopeptide (TPR) repeat protein
LIYYPLFTLLGFDGDWRTIYDFSSTPLLSGVTAAAHVVILILFWRFDRQGWFEAPAFASEAGQEQFERQTAEAAANPQDVALQLQVIDTLRRGGATQKAKYRLDQLLKQNPESGMAHLEMAALQSAGKSSVPKEAAENAQQALNLGLPGAGQKAFAYELIGRYQLERGRLEEAQNSLTEAITSLAPSGNAAAMIDLFITRSQVSRRQQNYNAAYEDLQKALTIAQRTGNEAAISQINSEQEILAKHSGQSYLAGSAEQIK